MHDRIYNERVSMNVYCDMHPLSVLRRRLTQDRFVTAASLRSIPSGRRVKVAGIMVIIHTPPTKSGKRVQFITLEDETGLIDAVAFPNTQERCARTILTSEVLAVQGRLHRQGKMGVSVSIVIERVLAPWSGSLVRLLEKARTPL
ncbi:MAG: OB-fold nucleic acid binding domain-containing protein [Desulfomonilaceae bacterium]